MTMKDNLSLPDLITRLERPEVWADGHEQRIVAEGNGDVIRTMHAYIQVRALCQVAEWEGQLSPELAETAMYRMKAFHQAVDARWLQLAEVLRRAAEREGQG